MTKNETKKTKQSKVRKGENENDEKPGKLKENSIKNSNNCKYFINKNWSKFTFKSQSLIVE